MDTLANQRLNEFGCFSCAADDFAAGHAPGAVNVPVKLKTADGSMVDNPEFTTQVKAALPDTGAPVLVGCGGGSRAPLAVSLLATDYHGLIIVPEGYKGWVACGLPIEK